MYIVSIALLLVFHCSLFDRLPNYQLPFEPVCYQYPTLDPIYLLPLLDSPADDNYDESLSTLRYADRAKQVALCFGLCVLLDLSILGLCWVVFHPCVWELKGSRLHAIIVVVEIVS